MSFKSLLALFSVAFALTACDDNTSTLGIDMMPMNDLITKTYKTYDVSTSSYEVGDSVLARTSTSYFGRFTDPVTGTTIKSDYLTQFNCMEGMAFPDSIVNNTITGVSACMYFTTYVGDSLTNMQVEVYALDSTLNPNADYYTNIDPTKYIKEGAKPVGSKWYTVSDRTIADTTRWRKQNTSNYAYPYSVLIPLDKSMGQQIFNAYRNDTTIFSNTSHWLKSNLPGSKGLYFKLKNGDGVMTYVALSRFIISFDYYDAENDTVKSGGISFDGTEEVVQATRFENNNIDQLMSDTEATYLKSPAGIFTMAEFPIDQLSANDTINSASITFTRYNDSSYSLAKENSAFRLGIPQNILMVRLDDYLNGFFEGYNLSDNITSYTTTFTSSTNTYSFNNISRLVTTMLKEKENGTANANYNKVLLIPVEITKSSTSSSSTSSIVKMNHDFSMSSARLVGGKNDKVKLEIIYSKFSSGN